MKANDLPRSVLQAEERLPFTVSVVRSDEQLLKAVDIRQAAYGRHVPALARKLREPEPEDRDAGAVILLAESKMDGSPLGTMRIQTNRRRPLALERSVTLPPWLRPSVLAEATRLGVAEGRAGHLVKMVLCKAFYLYSLACGIEWMVITARSPVDRQYEAALFQDLYPGQSFPMRHVNDIPHRVLGFEVGSAARRWAAADHPLSKFMVHTHHPDIDPAHADPMPWTPAAAFVDETGEALAVA